MVANLQPYHVAVKLIKTIIWPSKLYKLSLLTQMEDWKLYVKLNYCKLEELIPQKDLSQNLFNYQAKSKLKLELHSTW